MKRGRPFEPGNKFGRGRPKGSRNKTTLALQQILDEHLPTLMKKGIMLAWQGDGPLLRMFLNGRLPRPHDPPVKIGRLPMSTTDDLLQAHQTVMNKLASGVISPAQAKEVASLLETQRQLLETHNLAARIARLEDSRGPSQS